MKVDNIRGYLWPVFLLVTATGMFAISALAGLDPPHDIAGCLRCHQMTSTYPKLLPPLGLSPQNIDETIANAACTQCHCTDNNVPCVATHSSLTTADTEHDPWTVECWVCHNQHLQEQDRYNGSTYGKFIRRAINLANITGPGKSGTKPVVFKGQTGANSFADGDGATIDGICEVCHTRTSAWQNNGAPAAAAAHTGLGGRDCRQCHTHDDGFKAKYQCLDCHDDPTNPATNITRSDVKQQFNSTSHHVQRDGNVIYNTDCYQCHWEADSEGNVTTHHEAMPDAVVDLVIYGDSSRPDTYDGNVVKYTADGSRSQIVSLNQHCLGCHSARNSDSQPFADGKTPNVYAWDGTCTTNPLYNGLKDDCIANEGEAAWTPGTSVAERYSRPETAPWGKYDPALYPNVENKYGQSKAYSAHGNAVANQRGWNPLAWEAKTKVPAAIFTGGDLVYPGSGDYLYATRGSSTNTLYRYSISSDRWATMQSAPGTFSYGADLTAAGDGEYIYALRGSNSKGFYRYSISSDTWTILPDVPAPVSYGGSLVSPGSGDFIYALVGNYSARLFRYAITSNTWTELRAADGTFLDGADLVYPGAGDYLYATRGYATTAFSRYSISNNIWEAMADAPSAFDSGGSLAATSDGKYIYGLPGDGQTDFLRYSISNNNWIRLSALPEIVNNAGSLVNPGSGIYLYAMPGASSSSFYR